MQYETYPYFFIEPSDESIKPTHLWMKTDSVVQTIGTGCPLGCIYCNQQFLDVSASGEKIAGAIEFGIDTGVAVNDRIMVNKTIVRQACHKQVAYALNISPFFHPSMTILINNFSDPGLNWKNAINFAETIDLITKHSGPTVFITKMGISDQSADLLEQYKNNGGHPIVIITYSGLPKAIEPIDSQPRINAIERLYKRHIPVIVSIRPIIEGINDTDSMLHQIILNTHKYASMYILGGLYVYPNTPALFAKAGYPLSEKYINDKYHILKILNNQTKQRVRDIARSIANDIVVYDHSSCAIAAINTIFYKQPTCDPMAHWSTPNGLIIDKECSAQCLSAQLSICRSKMCCSYDSVALAAKSILNRIGHTDKDISLSIHQPNMLLINNGILTFSELATIMRNTGWRVDNLPNFSGLIHRLKQAFTRDINVSIDKLLGAIQAGQQWYLFVDGILDHNNNVNTLRYARSATRTRIAQIYDVNDLNDSNAIVELTSSIVNDSKCYSEFYRIHAEITKIIQKHWAHNSVNSQ